MTFDPKVYRNSKDGVGGPGDTKATDGTSDWTSVSLLKGLYYLLSVTGITVTGGTLATSAKQDTGNTTLAAIDGHVDGIEALITTTNATLTTIDGHVDGLETLAAAATPAGTNLIGRTVADASAATGGIASTARLLSAAGTSGDATNVKASAGRLYAIHGFNASSSVRYLKLFNSASAPTAGSGTPIKTLALPPLCGFAFDWPLGYSFATGLGYTLVTGSADNSSTSVTAADIVGLNVDYV